MAFFCLTGAVYSLNQRSSYGALSPIARMHEPGDQRLKVGMSLLTIRQLTKVLLSVPDTLSTTGFGVLLPKG